MIAPDTTVRRHERVVFRELSDDAGGVLLHLDTTSYHGINRIGVLIWGLLNEEPTFDALVEKVGAEVADPPPSLRRDLSNFLEKLGERGLVELDREDGQG